MAPLTPDQYTPGRRVKDPASGSEFDVRDSVSGSSGNRYLIVTDPTHDVVGLALLIPEGQVRDEYEARDPDEVETERAQEFQDRENRAEQAAHPAPDPAPAEVPATPAVTDAPGVTDPQNTPAPGPQGQDPAPAATTPQTTPQP